MKKFIFNYYKKFSCIGSKCLHNCCIGWEIKIDKRAKNKYEELQAKDKRFSIDNYKMGVFNLSKKMRCPYLEEDGLCYIIKNYGESYLCKTCKTHPRFITYFSGRTETGLGLSCEEACRVILNFKPKMKLVLVKDDKNAKRLSLFERELIAFRNRALKIAQDRKISIEERLDKLLTISKVDIRTRAYGEWVKIFNGLEKLKISDYKGEKLEKYSDFLNLSKILKGNTNKF